MEVPTDIHFRYLARRKKALEQYLLSLEKENFSELEKVGHQLKGNGVTFGYTELSVIGSHLEKAAHLKDMPSLERALKDFSQWVGQQIN